jgi:hypothetical protein
MRIPLRPLRSRGSGVPATTIRARDGENALKTMDRRPLAIIRAPTAREASSLDHGGMDTPS